MTDKEKWERALNEKVELAKRLPEVGRALEKVVDEVFEMTKGGDGRRSIVMDEIAGAFRQAQTDARNGKPLRIAETVTALGDSMARAVDRARNPQPARKLTPLRADTPIRALRSFRYIDAGNPNVLEHSVGTDAITLVPRDVAEAAKLAGAAEVLPNPAERRLQFVKLFQMRDPDDRNFVFGPGQEKLVAEPIASAALAAGAAVELERLLPEEVTKYRGAPLPAFPSDSRLSLSTGRPSRGTVDLGEFNNASDESLSPPKRAKARSPAVAGAA